METKISGQAISTVLHFEVYSLEEQLPVCEHCMLTLAVTELLISNVAENFHSIPCT